ncbi:MAG: RodZ domain-containing protein [Rhizomicrobium sp.]
MTKVTQLSLDGEGSRRRIHLREISGDSEAPLETVGQDLRTARLRRGEDLATVSRALKIRKEHLDAVEEGRVDNLPGKTYAIGFVRTYAAYLGLDVSAMVERFKDEISGRHDEHASNVSPIPDDESRRLPYGWRIVALIVMLLLGYGAWHLFSTGTTQESVPPAPQINPPKAAAATPRRAVAAVAQTAPASIPGAPAIPPTAVKTASKAAAAVPGQTPPQSQAGPREDGSAGAGTTYGAQNKGTRVILRAEGDTRLTVKGADGSTYLNRDLKAGDSYLVPNQPGAYLETSNAGALEVYLDGQALGRVGQNQEILGHVSLDPQSLVDRFDAH